MRAVMQPVEVACAGTFSPLHPMRGCSAIVLTHGHATLVLRDESLLRREPSPDA